MSANVIVITPLPAGSHNYFFHVVTFEAFFFVILDIFVTRMSY